MGWSKDFGDIDTKAIEDVAIETSFLMGTILTGMAEHAETVDQESLLESIQTCSKCLASANMQCEFAPTEALKKMSLAERDLIQHVLATLMTAMITRFNMSQEDVAKIVRDFHKEGLKTLTEEFVKLEKQFMDR